MAIFFAENSQNCPAAGVSPPTPIYDMPELLQYTQHSAQIRYFSNKAILTVVSSLLTPLAKLWLSA